MAQVLEEAVNRGYVDKNPARRLKLNKKTAEEKLPWSDDEVAIVQAALEEQNRFGWMQVTFLMGLHQAVRLRQSEIPLSCIDFHRRVIHYPNDYVKGRKGHSQPISPVFYPMLQQIVTHRKSIGKSTLCNIPIIQETRFLLPCNGVSF